MVKYRITQVNLSKLNPENKEHLMIVRLMMAFNDISMANACMVEYYNIADKAKSHLKRGGTNYFVRLGCGHLYEGLKIIRDLKKKSSEMYPRIFLQNYYG